MVSKFASFAALRAQIVRYCVESSRTRSLLSLNETWSHAWSKFTRVWFAFARSQIWIVLTRARCFVSCQRKGSKGRPWLHGDAVLRFEIEADLVLARTERTSFLFLWFLIPCRGSKWTGASLDNVAFECVLAWAGSNAVIFDSATSLVSSKTNICHAWFRLWLWHWIDCVVCTRSETSSAGWLLIQRWACFDPKSGTCAFWAHSDCWVLTGPRRVESLGKETSRGGFASHSDSLVRNCTRCGVLTRPRSLVSSRIWRSSTFWYSAAKIQIKLETWQN